MLVAFLFVGVLIGSVVGWLLRGGRRERAGYVSVPRERWDAVLGQNSRLWHDLKNAKEKAR